MGEVQTERFRHFHGKGDLGGLTQPINNSNNSSNNRQLTLQGWAQVGWDYSAVWIHLVCVQVGCCQLELETLVTLIKLVGRCACGIGDQSGDVHVELETLIRLVGRCACGVEDSGREMCMCSQAMQWWCSNNPPLSVCATNSLVVPYQHTFRPNNPPSVCGVCVHVLRVCMMCACAACV